VSGLRLPLAASIAGHAVGLALLLWFSARLPPLVLMPPAPPNAVAVIFEAPPAPPQPTPPPPPPPVKVEPPPPLPKPVELPKPAPVVLPPRPKPPPRHIVRRRIERPLRQPEQEPPPVEAPQTASLPPAYRPPPAPFVSLDYRNELAEWFAAHKHYPESARDRGEQGGGLLRFRVDRSGRVLSYALVRSTGYPDLDGAIEAMMQGATLPPFPPDMAANDIEVTMPFTFRLEQ
jgi:periplasmic protein TonB